MDYKYIYNGKKKICLSILLLTQLLLLSHWLCGIYLKIHNEPCISDAAGLNILNISSTLQKKLLMSYFSQNGIEYSIGRIPMASCDFSTHPYSYDDNEGDFQMQNFSLTKEDLHLKIPLMLTAMNMSKRSIKFFGSPWAAPAWMKTNGKMQGAGILKGIAGDKFHEAWALYFAKFLKGYEDKGVKIWGLTVQNEPSTGFIPGFVTHVILK